MAFGSYEQSLNDDGDGVDDVDDDDDKLFIYMKPVKD